MSIMTCEISGKLTAKTDVCNYCKKRVDVLQVKSSRRKDKGKIFICKRCWSDLDKRGQFKATENPNANQHNDRYER